jgi:hypothetical protein
MNIPDIVKIHVLKHNGRMPETQEEVDGYLDLISHAKEYEKSLLLSSKLSKGFMKKFGFKTPDEVKKEGKQLFSH